MYSLESKRAKKRSKKGSAAGTCHGAQSSHFSSCLTILTFISEAGHGRPIVLELAQGT